jgi:hypothetical protein
MVRDYASALGMVKNDRASAVLWDLIRRSRAAAEQAEPWGTPKTGQ